MNWLDRSTSRSPAAEAATHNASGCPAGPHSCCVFTRALSEMNIDVLYVGGEISFMYLRVCRGVSVSHAQRFKVTTLISIYSLCLVLIILIQ